jgi:hypothetical protein
VGRFFGPTATAISASGFFRGSAPPAPPVAGWIARTPGSAETAVGAVFSESTGTSIYITNGGHVFRSTDNGVTWHVSVTQLSGEAVLGAVWFSTALVVGTLDLLGHPSTASSTDDGVTWALAALPLTVAVTNVSVAVMVTDQLGTIMCGLDATAAGGNYFTSLDGGQTWSPHNDAAISSWGNAFTQQTCLFDQSAGSNPYVSLAKSAGGNTVLVESNDGITWALVGDFGVTTDATLAGGFGAYMMGFLNDNKVFVGSTPAQLFANRGTLFGTGLTGTLTCLCFDLNTSNFYAFDNQGGTSTGQTNGSNFVPEPLNFAAGVNCQTCISNDDAVVPTGRVYAFGGVQTIAQGSSISTRNSF